MRVSIDTLWVPFEDNLCWKAAGKTPDRNVSMSLMSIFDADKERLANGPTFGQVLPLIFPPGAFESNNLLTSFAFHLPLRWLSV
jgi:hypothetical protein